MRDIGSKILRYRLSRYASPDDPWRRRIVRLVIPALLLWVVYAGVLSEHSWWRLWRLHREHDQTATRLSIILGVTYRSADMTNLRYDTVAISPSGVETPFTPPFKPETLDLTGIGARFAVLFGL